jgi:hypothetical protein
VRSQKKVLIWTPEVYSGLIGIFSCKIFSVDFDRMLREQKKQKKMIRGQGNRNLELGTLTN